MKYLSLDSLDCSHFSRFHLWPELAPFIRGAHFSSPRGREGEQEGEKERGWECRRRSMSNLSVSSSSTTRRSPRPSSSLCLSGHSRRGRRQERGTGWAPCRRIFWIVCARWARSLDSFHRYAATEAVAATAASIAIANDLSADSSPHTHRTRARLRGWTEPKSGSRRR